MGKRDREGTEEYGNMETSSNADISTRESAQAGRELGLKQEGDVGLERDRRLDGKHSQALVNRRDAEDREGL